MRSWISRVHIMPFWADLLILEKRLDRAQVGIEPNPALNLTKPSTGQDYKKAYNMIETETAKIQRAVAAYDLFVIQANRR